jgi:ABC transport system ATP-binding/permease protein
MALLQLQDVSLSFGAGPVLDSVNLNIDFGERVCLVGRNGQGKSCLMKIIASALTPDAGNIKTASDTRIAYLQQDVPEDIVGTIFEVVSDGHGQAARLVAEYEALSLSLVDDATPERLARLEVVQEKIDDCQGWDFQQQVENHLARFELDKDARFESLSGGMKRRVLLAKCLISRPQILMLDEPTNHLDVEAITWLEGFLQGFPGALLFVTHDRMFLRKVATRIVDLDRGHLTSWPGNFDLYQERKQAALEAELSEWGRFDKKLAEEETWIRQGIKARRTRNEGRVRALKRLRVERGERRDRIGQAKLQLQSAERSGREVVKAEGVRFAWGSETIVEDFSTTIMRGDRVGFIGPNGCGKTTLLRVLLGEIQAQAGSVKLGTRLEVLYFDQLRDQLDMEATVQDNISDGNDTVIVNGRPRHVIGYLRDFLFSPHRARSPVKNLSGGEQNRLLLARLFTRSANVLVLDEPTNDLDAETLELLETILLEFKGTLLLVSHDREFLNNVVTSTIAFDPDGRARNYVGGYDDWLRQRVTAEEVTPVAVTRSHTPEAPKKAARKLSFNERKELESLPQQIETFEAEQGAIHERLNDPALYQERGDEIPRLNARLESLTAELTVLYARWEELESLSSESS